MINKPAWKHRKYGISDLPILKYSPQAPILCGSLLKDLTIMSDVFMQNVFKKRECTEYVLQVMMDKKDLKVIDQVLQKDYKNLQGRSAILDCVARDSEGKQMDVEIQQDNEGASPKRARYHSGLTRREQEIPHLYRWWDELR